ncbi:MAG TPA: YCF48-related protein, partial [Candidatus Angelobacter sp.]|nr:YCF48-related protein [Candidatus Angelobacter sp.]
MNPRLFPMGQLKLVISAICSLITLDDCCFSQTWSQTGAPTNEEWQAMACSADGSKLLAVNQINVYTSTNSGTTWTPANPPPSLDLWHAATTSADGSVMIAGTYGGLYISTNSGVDWQLNSNAPQNVWYWSAACSADGTKAVAAAYYDTAAGNPQLLYVSQDSGATWTAASAPSNNWSAVASSADGTKLIALAFNGLIYRSTDSGTTWTSNNIVGYWRSVACSADGTKVVAVASPGQIYTSTNSGLNWNSHFVPDAGIGFGSVATSANGVRLLAVGFESSS